MEQNSTVLLVGGPDAGKTNYLARLWLSINSTKYCLKPDGLPTELNYLNEIADFILKGKFAPRTQAGLRRDVVIPVKSETINSVFKGKLVVPDVQGEEWMKIYRKREWSDVWENAISSVSGCLVFVRADSENVIPAVDWITFANLPKSPLNLNDQIPTQVVMVDWLQCLQQALSESMDDNFRPRYAVILSAYDLLPKDQQKSGPEDYLKANFPLLWQYIDSNRQYMDIRIFGVSIAGGDFAADENFKKRYLQGKPQEAGYVIYDSGSGIVKSSDLTLPVAWALRHIEIEGLS